MNSNQLKEQKSELLNEIEAIESLATTEERELTEDENTEVDNILAKVEEMNKKIERAEKLETERKTVAKKIIQDSEKEEIRKVKGSFSMARAINGYLKDGKWEGAEAEVIQEGERELKASGMSPLGFAVPSSFLKTEKRTDIDQNTSGINSVDLDSYVDATRAYSVYDKVGINFQSAVGNVKSPIVTAHNYAWVAAENTAAADIGQNLTSKTASPKWCRGYVDISKTLLAQNPGAMDAVMRDLGRAEANLMDTALFSTTSVSNAPAAIAATSGVQTFTEASYSANASVFSDFAEALQTLAENDAMSDMVQFVAAPILFGELLKSAQVSSVNPAMTGEGYLQKVIAGHKAWFTTATTSATTSGDVVAGDFAAGVRAYQWGGVDFFVDPYSVSLNDQVRLVGHKRVDWVVPKGGDFVKFTSALA